MARVRSARMLLSASNLASDGVLRPGLGWDYGRGWDEVTRVGLTPQGAARGGPRRGEGCTVTAGVVRRSLLTPEGRSTHGTDPAASGSPSSPSSRLGSPLGSLGQPRAAWDPFSPSRRFSPVPGAVSPDRAGTAEAAEAGKAWGGGGSGLSARVKAAKDLAEAAQADLRAKEVAEAAAGEGLRALSLARQRVGESPSGCCSGDLPPSASESPQSPRACKGGATSLPQPWPPRPWKLRTGTPLPRVSLATPTAYEAVEVADGGDASGRGGGSRRRGWHLLGALLTEALLGGASLGCLG